MSDGLKAVFDFVVSAVRKEERREIEEKEKNEPVKGFTRFTIIRPFSDLVGPCKKRAEHHRKHEQSYTKDLEEAEKTLREKGVTMDVTDPATGASYSMPSGSFCSGAINISSSTNVSQAPKFTPKVDPVMLGAVEKAKTKMLEHRQKAVEYEKLGRVFACASPDQKVELTIDDIDFFRLGIE